jgi:hypothetical protein
MMASRDPIQFLKTISTATRYLEFIPEERLAELDPHIASHIEELEDLLCRLSCEAEAVLWHASQSHTSKRGGGQ